MISEETYNFLSRVYKSGSEALTKLVVNLYPLDEVEFIEKSFHENFIEVLRECPKVIRELCNDINDERISIWFYQSFDYKRTYPLVQLDSSRIEQQIRSLHFETSIAYKIMRCDDFILMKTILYTDTTIDCDVTKDNLFWQIITATNALDADSHQRSIMFGKK